MAAAASGEVLVLVLSWIVTNGLTFAVVILDERKLLSERQLERAWPPASRDAAIVGFSVLALPIHFMRTRGHFRSVRGVLGYPLGLVMGLVAVAAVVLASSLVLEALAWALGLPEVG